MMAGRTPGGRGGVLRRRLRWIAPPGLAGLVVAATFCLCTGRRLTAPATRLVGPPPANLAATPVLIPSGSGSQLAGWLAGPGDARASILLLHGIRADRRSMSGRAGFLLANGYRVLLIDFQAHGESAGRRITLGQLESRDAAAAIGFLRNRFPGAPVGVIGSSLGGVATVLAAPQAAPDAAVLEAVFQDVPTAVGNRLQMRFGRAGRWFTPLLTAQVGPTLGVPLEDLSPLRRMPAFPAPVLVIGGSRDRHATVAESDALFAAARGPKERWVVEGAAHVDLHRHAGADYERRVLGFFDQHLGTPTPPR